MKSWLCLAAWLIGWIVPVRTAAGQAELPVVRAVFFYSPACRHCHLVINETLPPLYEQYGAQLQIAGINVNQPNGLSLFQAAAEHYQFEGLGVPTLIIGGQVLRGSVDIPEQLPRLIEAYLEAGGVDWPAIPGLAEALGAVAATASPTSAGTLVAPTTVQITPTATTMALGLAPVSPRPGAVATALANFAQDPRGNGLAIVVLIGMLLVAGRVGWGTWKGTRPRPSIEPWRHWLIVAMCLAGLVVAGYLTFVETWQVQAVCGPIGNCNAVQQSPYARLFGVLPIGALGLVGYAAILAAWAISCWAPVVWADLAQAGLGGLGLAGTAFSIYLTFLEPFVIGATCAWCLTSAALMTGLFWLTAEPGWAALVRLAAGDARRPRRAAS
jgi:uncharacterized membrane protein